jgi:hypothetical protein
VWFARDGGQLRIDKIIPQFNPFHKRKKAPAGRFENALRGLVDDVLFRRWDYFRFSTIRAAMAKACSRVAES